MIIRKTVGGFVSEVVSFGGEGSGGGGVRTTEKGGNEVADAVEEEEFRHDERLHEHHCAGNDN